MIRLRRRRLYAGFHRKAGAVIRNRLLQFFHKILPLGPRSHKAHLAFEDIPELREFVEGTAPDEPADDDELPTLLDEYVGLDYLARYMAVDDVTANYDGVHKHRTRIGKGAFIGSDTIMRAPVSIGEGSFTGAASLVTRDVPAGETVLGVPARIRTRQPKTEESEPLVDLDFDDDEPPF